MLHLTVGFLCLAPDVIKQSDSSCPHEMCLNSWIPLVRSTCELIVHQQKNNKESKWDQIVTKREFTGHREV